MRVIFKRGLALALMLAVIISCGVAAVPMSVSAENDGDIRYTQKIMAVVFDTSTSMRYDLREPAAKYALSLLMSTMDEKDEMYIVPMHNCPDGGIYVDLSNSDRNKVVENIMSNHLIDANGSSTPSSSMYDAIEILRDRGLRNNDELNSGQGEPNKEYWLIVLTDGWFESKGETNYQATTIHDAVKDYDSLHKGFVSFSEGGADLSTEPILDNITFFTPYYTVPEVPTDGETDLVEVLQEITNLITGRYPLSDSQFSVQGNTLTIDLSQIPFSISSLSIIAQNCGATIGRNDVEYDSGKPELNPKVHNEKICTIVDPNKYENDKQLGIADGCSFTTVSNSYLYGGTLTYTFSAPISIDQLSIFAQPILDISAYMEATINGEYRRVTSREINENLGAGEKISVGYEVFEQVNNTAIDLEKVFGDVETSVVYGDKTYQIGEKFPLEVGTKQLTVEISLMNGAFTLRKTETLVVEEDPSFFRVEASGDTTVDGLDPKTSAIFTVYKNNNAATAAELAGHTFTAIATSSDGTVIFEKDVQPESSGKIVVPYKIETNRFDVYSISLTVTTPENISRTATHSVTYAPSTLDLVVEGQNDLVLTQNDLWNNTSGYTFVLSTNGQPFPVSNGITSFSLTVGDVDVTQHAVVSGNTLTYVPTKENLGSVYNNPAEYDVTLSFTGITNPSLNTSASAKLTVEKTLFSIIPIESDNDDIDRFHIGESGAVLYFSFKKDDILFTEAEIQSALDNGEIAIEKDSLFTFFLSPASVTMSVENIDGTPVLAVYAVQDAGSYVNWHSSAFIFSGGDKNITLTYVDATATDAFNVVSSSVFQHILRITVLLLEIAAIVYIIIWLIGFIKGKPLPEGAFIKLNSDGTWKKEDVNESVLKLVHWHAWRFIHPKSIWKNQSPVEPEDQVMGCQGIQFERSDLKANGKAKIRLKPQELSGGDAIYKVSVVDSNIDILNGLYSALKAGRRFELDEELTAKSLTVEDLFTRDSVKKPTDRITMSTKSYYALYDVKGKLSYAVCFFTFRRKK